MPVFAEGSRRFEMRQQYVLCSDCGKMRQVHPDHAKSEESSKPEESSRTWQRVLLNLGIVSFIVGFYWFMLECCL